MTATVSRLLCVSTAALMMFRGRWSSEASRRPPPRCEKHIPSLVHILNVFPQNCHPGENPMGALAIVCHLRGINALKDLRRGCRLQTLLSGDVRRASVSNLNTAPYRATKTLNNYRTILPFLQPSTLPTAVVYQPIRPPACTS